MATLQTGTAPNQIPTNGDLGDLAFQSKESVQFTGGRGALSSINLNQIYKEIAATAVDVFIYDTSKDSDGGAWRKRTQHTSWYNEELNTATRGSRREFPAVAVIVATTTTLTIYDGDDPAMPMWMVFEKNAASDAWQYWYLGRQSVGTLTSVAMLNGSLYVAQTYVATFFEALLEINFLRDDGVHHIDSVYKHQNPISSRNGKAGGYYQLSTAAIINIVSVNDVAMTVLPNAPIDAATGLPIPTIAVATNSGVSIIKHDGTVINLLTTSGNQNSISFTASKGLETHGGGGVAYFGWGWYSIPQASTNTSDYLISDNAWSTTNIRRQGSNGNSVLYPMTTTNYGIVIRESAGVNTTDKLILIALANPAGYSLQSYLTTKYNTGWMPGDVKGAWLSDTTQETVVGTNLVANGDFSNGTTGWVADGNTGLAVSGGQATITQTSTNGLIYYTLPDFPAGTYTFSIKYVGGTHTNLYCGVQNSGGTTQYSLAALSGLTANTTVSATFTTTGTATGYRIALYGYFWGGTASGSTLILDDVVIRKADADRSVNNKGLQVFGNITKTPVAAGADLVAYSGFSTSNYLSRPNAASLGIYSGDFFFSYWIKINNHKDFNNAFSIGGNGAYGSIELGSDAAGKFLAVFSSNYNESTGSGSWDLVQYSTSVIPTNQWTHICWFKKSNSVYCFINGLQDAVTNSVSTNPLQPSNSKPLQIGTAYRIDTGSTGRALDGSMALARISATAPSAEQIAKMYNDEKYLFQDGAKATLYGTSDSVTALAYDEDTQLLHAGTSSGRSVFRGLRRVDNTTTAVGAAISAANGLVAED